MVCGCFPVTEIELNHCDRDLIAAELKNLSDSLRKRFPNLCSRKPQSWVVFCGEVVGKGTKKALEDMWFRFDCVQKFYVPTFGGGVMIFQTFDP